MRGGRLAALGFFTGALSAIPANLILSGFSPVELFFVLLVAGLGLLCLLIEWEEKRAQTLYSIAALAILVIAVATIVASPVYAANYLFVALFVAMAAPYRIVVAALALIMVAMILPAIFMLGTDSAAWARVVIFAPALAVTSFLTFELTRMLEKSRQSFWELSREDALTGIGNYRSLKERLSEEIARHRRHGRKLSVIVLDLDGFKRINDELGHLFGDRVLVDVADAMRQAVRSEDSIYRQGGDEFAVIAPDTGPADIQPVIDRLRERIGTLAPGETELTVGSGVATFPADGDSAEDLLGLADVRLLEAKRDRRPALEISPI